MSYGDTIGYSFNTWYLRVKYFLIIIFNLEKNPSREPRACRKMKHFLHFYYSSLLWLQHCGAKRLCVFKV